MNRTLGAALLLAASCATRPEPAPDPPPEELSRARLVWVAAAGVVHSPSLAVTVTLPPAWRSGAWQPSEGELARVARDGTVLLVRVEEEAAAVAHSFADWVWMHDQLAGAPRGDVRILRVDAYPDRLAVDYVLADQPEAGPFRFDRRWVERAGLVMRVATLERGSRASSAEVNLLFAGIRDGSSPRRAPLLAAPPRQPAWDVVRRLLAPDARLSLFDPLRRPAEEPATP